MSPQNHDDLTDQVGRTLHDHADGITRSPITLGDVKGTATRIRRRRAITASAAVAAAVAIIVPTVAFNSSLFQNADGTNPDPASQNPTPIDVKLGEPLDLNGLPAGDAPKIVWLEGTTLHKADGSTLTLDRTYTDVVPYDDGWLATYIDDEGNPTGVQLDASGNPTGGTFATAYSIAVSSDGEQVLFVREGNLFLHDNGTGQNEGIVFDGGPEVDPIGVTADTAYYNVQLADYSKDARWWRDGDEHDPQPSGTYFYTSASADGWTTAIVKVTDDGTCSVSVTPDGTEAGRSCDVLLDQLAPDSLHILASPSYGDGYAAGQLAVTTRDPSDADNSTRLLDFLQLGESDAGFMQAAWEDDDHVLAVMPLPIAGTPDKLWHLVRIGLDGSIENTVEPIRAAEDANPFRLTGD